jgi:hypothetical protein
MRIAHIAPFYAPVIGGVEEVVKRVAEYTASRAPDGLKSLRYKYDSRYRERTDAKARANPPRPRAIGIQQS